MLVQAASVTSSIKKLTEVICFLQTSIVQDGKAQRSLLKLLYIKMHFYTKIFLFSLVFHTLKAHQNSKIL